MVTLTWILSLAVQIWSHFYSEAATCLTQFDIHLMCPQYGHGTPLVIDNNTQSALARGSSCSTDKTCRSFQYNASNNECRTNAERLAESYTICSQLIRYGEIQTAACRRSRLFDPCFQNDDCIDANSSCLNGRCECSYGHPYDYRTDSCPAGCAHYGNTLHEVSYHVLSNNIIDLKNITIAECHAKCFSDKNTFVCRFIEYEVDVSSCYLSDVNALSAPPYAVEHEDNPLYRQWDRNCA